MFLIGFPLLLIPFALYNMIAFLLDMTFGDTMFGIPLQGSGVFPVTTEEVLIGLALLLLYLEMLKSTRLAGKAVMDRLLSLLVFLAMAAEFLLVAKAATSTFFLLLMISFVDALVGFTLAPRRNHDVVLENPDRSVVFD